MLCRRCWWNVTAGCVRRGKRSRAEYLTLQESETDCESQRRTRDRERRRERKAIKTYPKSRCFSLRETLRHYFSGAKAV